MADVSILAGAAYGPSDSAKVMEISLKLRADSGNAAVLKQLTTQVHDAFTKVVKETEQVGEKLVDKAHEWGKSMGESIRKALEKAASDAEKSARKEGPESRQSAAEKQPPAGREVQAHPEVSQPKSPPTSAEAARAPDQPEAKKTETAPAKEEKSTTDKVSTLAQKSTSAAKHFGEAASTEKKPAERVAAAVEGAVESREAVKTGMELLNRVKAVATGGQSVGEVGVKGMITNLAKGGLASVGGWGGVAGAAQVAGIGAVAIAGGVALHDGFKTLLNKVGFLGGNFDTLSGTVMEWHESTKRSAEIEKKIAETQEAHQQALEQMQRNQQNTRSVYEAKDRIEESQKHQKEAAGLVPVGATYARRFKAVDAEHVGTERDLQKRDRNYAIDDRGFASQQYEKKLEEKGRERDEAAKAADDTRKKNDQRKQEAAGPVDLQKEVLQEEKAVKLANEMRDLAKDRTSELQSQLAAMDQQVRAAEHQVAAAREQVKAEQEKVTAHKAQLSMLSEDQQKAATTILKKFNETKHLSREDALTLQKLGITQGRIGTAINDTMAQGLDPELAKQFKAAGGEEGLEKAQQHLKESTDDLADAQNEAIESLDNFMESLQEFAAASDKAVAAQKQLEKTRSDKEGYSNPNDLQPGEKPRDTAGAVEMVKAAIEAAHADFAKAMNEVADAVVNGSKGQAADANRMAQRIKEAHK